MVDVRTVTKHATGEYTNQKTSPWVCRSYSLSKQEKTPLHLFNAMLVFHSVSEKLYIKDTKYTANVLILQNQQVAYPDRKELLVLQCGIPCDSLDMSHFVCQNYCPIRALNPQLVK